MEKQDNFSVKVERTIERTASDVFRAIKEGRLFFNCSADTEASTIDFRVGGKYTLLFKSYGVTQQGEFLEIVPDQKIVFTWCQSFEEPLTPDTTVTIELIAEGKKTHLKLNHVGFKTKDSCDDHEGGWTNGLTDLIAEIQGGKLRLVRTFAVPVSKLYETCKNPEVFYAPVSDSKKAVSDFKVGGLFKVPSQKGDVDGTYLEIVPNQRIVFTWNSHGQLPELLNSKVTLIFDEEEDNGSSLELIHEGLIEDEQQKQCRTGWQHVMNALLDFLK